MVFSLPSGRAIRARCIAAGLLAASIIAGPGSATSDLLAPWVASAPPPLALADLTGVARDLGGEQDRTVLVHFFATWCEPCVPELAALERFRVRTDSMSLTILAVSVGESPARLHRFFADRPVGFPILLDPERVATRDWQVGVLPSTFILAPGLRPRLLAEGDVDWDSIDPAGLADRGADAPSKHSNRSGGIR